MSSVLAVASAASSLMDHIEDLSESKTHHVIHWSTPLYMGAAGIGLIVAIAGFILGQYAVAIIGALLAGTNAIASLYIHRFYVLNKLEDYNHSLIRRNQEQGRQIDTLENNIAQLIEVKEGYNHLQVRHQELLTEQKEQTEELTKKVIDLSSKLIAANQVIENIYNEFGTLVHHVNSFADENGVFQSHLLELNASLGRIKEIEGDFNIDLKEFGQENDRYNHLNRIFHEYLKAWKATLAYIEEVEKNERKQFGNTVEAVQSLIPIIRKMEENGDELSKTADQFEAIESDMQQLFSNAQQFSHFIKLKQDPRKWEQIQRMMGV
ncbi:MAG: hypothetical protein WD595_02575 [Waddliaceae bacterium]